MFIWRNWFIHKKDYLRNRLLKSEPTSREAHSRFEATWRCKVGGLAKDFASMNVLAKECFENISNQCNLNQLAKYSDRQEIWIAQYHCLCWSAPRGKVDRFRLLDQGLAWGSGLSGGLQPLGFENIKNQTQIQKYRYKNTKYKKCKLLSAYIW